MVGRQSSLPGAANRWLDSSPSTRTLLLRILPRRRDGWRTMTPFLPRSTLSWQTGRPIIHVPSDRQTTSGMYLLDTNALSEMLKKRPKPQFLTRLRRHPSEMFFTSCICVMELRHGSRRREDHAVFWQRITHEVLSRVTILDFSVSEAVVAGDIFAHLARRGELIGVEDVLIGATALVREYTVVTGNVRHFERIPALQVENWLV